MTVGGSAARAAGLDEVPADLQKAYEGMDEAQPKGSSLMSLK